MEALELARLQFAVTAGLHFLFVLLTLGLVTVVAIMQTRYAVTGRPIHRRMTRFWGQLYVINYAVGIATGIVMEFQFGLSWSGLSMFVGDVFGAPLALETLVAFFLESTFLGLWIFGWNRFNRWVHLSLIWLVALTAYASAYFVMVANGFLQHPVGYELTDRGARLVDFGALLNNPAAVVAMGHVVGAAVTTGGVFVMGVSAYHLRRRTEDQEFFQRSLRLGAWVGALATLPLLSFGFGQFGYISAFQPTKLDGAAVGAPLGFMIQIGFLLWMVLWAVALLVLLRGWFFRRRILLKILVFTIPLPFVAAILGWLVRELGRQPWAVYGVLRTEDAFSGVSTATMLGSLIAFSLVLGALAVVDWYLLAKLARRGPGAEALGAPPDEQPRIADAGNERLEVTL